MVIKWLDADTNMVISAGRACLVLISGRRTHSLIAWTRGPKCLRIPQLVLRRH